MPESMTLQKAAVCGLWCGARTLHRATLEGGNRLETLAQRLGLSIENARCKGCRSDTLFQHCRACGHAPVSPFALEHREAVKTALRPRAKEASHE